MIQDLALYTIETELAELLELREGMVEAGELPESIAAIDKQIEAYCSAEVAKVDRIAGAIRACERNMEVAEMEANRLKERARAWEMRAKRIKEAALRAMQARGIKSLETPDNKLTVCGNGGKEPVEFTGEAVPAEFCRITISMPLDQWEKWSDHFLDLGIDICEESGPTPENTAIREALKRGETVPGAKLLPRGEHLRLK